MIEKFDELYLKKSSALQIVFRDEIDSIKLENHAAVEKFFNDFWNRTMD